MQYKKYKKILFLTLMSVININANAEYMVKIPLEQNSVSFTDAEVTGYIGLNPSKINRGESSTISWDYTYADSINVEDVGTFTSKNGSVPVNPLTSRSYNIEVINGSKTKNEVLNLTVLQPNQNIVFNANPTRIGIGQSTTLNWSVSNSYGVNITDVGNDLQFIGDATQTVNVEGVPNAIINSFTIDKEKITTGNSVLFSWNVSNVESLSLNPFGLLVQNISGSQSMSFNTAGSFAYTL